MHNLVVVWLLSAAAVWAQYKVEPAGTHPPDLPAAIAETLQKDGVKVTADNGTVVCEMWFRTSAPSGPKTSEEGVAIPTIPHGALIGVVRFSGNGGSDRRGQRIKPGVYTLRYSLQPVNGDHLGVAPQRDFLVMTPLADDKNPGALPGFDELMAMSRKASGTPHPAVLSMASSSLGKFPDVAKEGENDWVLHTKIGEVAVGVIVVGKVE